ncbi:MAG: ABC transporter permease [Armatimonadetes bacterium]|nr:ABC transporter permease [Armatimonadota bacterium]
MDRSGPLNRILRQAGRALQVQQAGLLAVILVLGTVLTLFAGSHQDPLTGLTVNNFLNANTLLQTATDASFFAIMAVGATMVIISGGIDLSVGSVFALAGVTMGLVLRTWQPENGLLAILAGLALSVGMGVLCGLVNGCLMVGLRVHPFIITLGTMWIFRGIAFVASRAESILVPDALTDSVKASLGLGGQLAPIPLLAMVAVAALGSVFLSRTVLGRHIFAVGGNAEASRYAGLSLGRVYISVFAVAGLTAGIAAYLGGAFYGSTSCADATGYELYVIASAVVGGASLQGGKGSVISAMLGALLITLIRQSIRTLHLDQNYEWIIIGCAIIVAVVLDRASAVVAEKRLTRIAPDTVSPEEGTP